MKMRRWRRSLRRSCSGRKDVTNAAGSALNAADGGKPPNSLSELRSPQPRIKGRIMAEAFARHSMVKASAAGWTAVMKRYPELASEPIIAGWAHADRPLVVR